MKEALTFLQSQVRMSWQYFQTHLVKLNYSSLFLWSFMIFFFVGVSEVNAQDPCDINNGWWKSKYLTLNSGIEDGDTVDLVSCQVPWDIRASDLKYYDYLKNRYCGKRYPVIVAKRRDFGYYGYYGPCVKLKTFCYKVDLPENAPEGMYQLWKYEYVVEDVYCHRTYSISYYLALYDHGAPLYQCFPSDTSVASVADLPPVDEKVKIIDFCQYVAWWNVETKAVVDSTSGDTVCYVRTWSAGDPSGNESSKDQKIWIKPDTTGGQALRQVVAGSNIVGKDWTVYPNPVKSSLHINIRTDENIDYTVYDALGRSVRSGIYHQGQVIKFDNLNPGVYHLQLRDKEQILGTKKVLLLE